MIFAGVIAVFPFYHSCHELTGDVLRIHIKANSNSAADQSLKLAVRDRVRRECSALFDSCDSKDEALAVTQAHLQQLRAAAADEVRAQGFDYPVSAQTGLAYFNTRFYDRYTMPAGWYDALRLTIGDGDGDNWWCVIYPSLCVGAACEDQMEDRLSEGEYTVVTSDQLDFRFKLVEYFEGFLNLFR